MKIQECYQKLGGDYAQVEKLLPSVSLINRFIKKFLDDGSYSELCHATEDGKREAAFRAAHTMKGISANLGFSKLLSSVSELTELLRAEADVIPEEAFRLMEEVRTDYDLTAGAIRDYLATADQQ